MRIGFVVYGGLDRVSGGFLYDRQVVAGLQTLGHTVDVVGLPWPSYRRALAHNLRPLPAVLDRCQVVIEDELIHPSVFLRHRRLRRAGVKIVGLVHNLAGQQPSTPWRGLVERCERAYLQSIDGAVTVSADTLGDIRGQIGPALPMVVAYAGRDHLQSGMDGGGGGGARGGAWPAAGGLRGDRGSSQRDPPAAAGAGRRGRRAGGGRGGGQPGG
jgi:hypothetical protein